MSFAHGGGEREFVPIRIAVLTVSDSRDQQSDKSGRLLIERLTRAGHQLAEKLIVPDDIYQIRAVVSRWIADADVDSIIVTGTAAPGELTHVTVTGSTSTTLTGHDAEVRVPA